MALLIVMGPFLLLYWPSLQDTWSQWLNNPDYSHGLLIPFVSLYFIWQRWDDLRNIPARPSLQGYYTLAAGLALFMVGRIGDFDYFINLSMLLVIMALIHLFSGVKTLYSLLFPVSYLVFMFPYPFFIYNGIAVKMKLISSQLAEMLAGLFSLPVFRQGNIFNLPDFSFEVVDACSGIRSLSTVIILAFAMGYIFKKSLLKRAVLVLICFPLAIALNMGRLFFTMVLGHFYGKEVALGFLHEAAGVIVFILGLILLYGANEFLDLFPVRRAKE